MPVPVDLSNPDSATYPGTGAIPGAPVALELEAKISGTEYAGSPSPLTLIKTYAPAGVAVHTQGFATCSESHARRAGPRGMPTAVAREHGWRSERCRHLRRIARPRAGDAAGVLQPRRRPDIRRYRQIPSLGGSDRKGDGHRRRAPRPRSANCGRPKFRWSNRSGAPDASVEQFKVVVGAAFKQGKKLVSYTTSPKGVPEGRGPAKGRTVVPQRRNRCERIQIPVSHNTKRDQHSNPRPTQAPRNRRSLRTRGSSLPSAVSGAAPSTNSAAIDRQ